MGSVKIILSYFLPLLLIGQNSYAHKTTFKTLNKTQSDYYDTVLVKNSKDLDSIKVVIEKGYNILKKDDEGFSLIMKELSKESINWKNVFYLFDNGAELNISDIKLLGMSKFKCKSFISEFDKRKTSYKETNSAVLGLLFYCLCSINEDELFEKYSFYFNTEDSIGNQSKHLPFSEITTSFPFEQYSIIAFRSNMENESDYLHCFKYQPKYFIDNKEIIDTLIFGYRIFMLEEGFHTIRIIMPEFPRPIKIIRNSLRSYKSNSKISTHGTIEYKPSVKKPMRYFFTPILKREFYTQLKHNPTKSVPM